MELEGRKLKALLDSGSQASTVSHSTYLSLGLTVHGLDELFQLEGAGNHKLDYLGYAEAVTNFPELINIALGALF